MEEYVHPWFQTFTMFLGEFLCLVAFQILSFRENRRKTKAGELLVCIWF